MLAEWEKGAKVVCFAKKGTALIPEDLQLKVVFWETPRDYCEQVDALLDKWAEEIVDLPRSRD